MNFYKRHIGDYMKDTAHLSLLEHGIYARLMDVYYTREAGIPSDQAARLIGARTKEEKEALHSVLSEFFTLADGDTWIQMRCEREINAANSQAITNRRIAEEREAKRRERTVHESLHDKDTNRLTPTHGDRAEVVNLSRLQTPDSRLHKPDKTPERAGALADARAVTGLDVESFERWLDYRAQRKPAIRTASLVAAAKELARFGDQQSVVVEHSIANGYQGLFAPKVVSGIAPRASPVRLKTAEEWEEIERARGEHAAN